MPALGLECKLSNPKSFLSDARFNHDLDGATNCVADDAVLIGLDGVIEDLRVNGGIGTGIHRYARSERDFLIFERCPVLLHLARGGNAHARDGKFSIRGDDSKCDRVTTRHRGGEHFFWIGVTGNSRPLELYGNGQGKLHLTDLGFRNPGTVSTARPVNRNFVGMDDCGHVASYGVFKLAISPVRKITFTTYNGGVKRLRFIGFLLPAVLVGCGGAGGGSDSITPTPTPTPATEKGTALFNVDVASGKVQIQPLETDGAKPAKGKAAVLTGSAVTFETTTLLAEGGEVGRRSIKVRLKNNLNEAIGVGRPIRIQFGPIGPATNYETDLRDRAVVSSAFRCAGSGYDDGPATTALTTFPTAVAVGQDGSIYFNGTDARLRKLQDGYISTVALSVPADSLAYLRDPATGREFLVAPCSSLHSVKLIAINSGLVTTIGGADATPGNVDGTVAASRFSGPRGVAIDSAVNQILVADTGNGSIRTLTYAFSAVGLTVSAVATRSSGLTDPRAIAMANNRSLLVTENSLNRVRIYLAATGKSVVFGSVGNAVGDGSSALFSTLGGVTAVGDTFYLADTGNNQIKRIVLKATAAPLMAKNWSVAVVAGFGTSGYLDGPGSTALFGSAVGLATEPGGRLLVADNGANAIRRVVSQGSFDFGTPDGTSVGQPKLTNPTGFADLNGLQRPYIDINQRVEPGQTIEAGEWQFSIPGAVNAFRFAVTVEAPTSVYAGLEAVLNPSGGPGSPNVVAQYLSRNNSYGGTVGKLENVSFDSVTTYMSTDGAGNIFVSDGLLRIIRRIDTAGNVTLVAGKAGFSGTADGSGSDARFGVPDAIQVNKAGTEIIVADEQSQTIRRVALYYDGADPTISSNWGVSTIAGAAGVTGDANGTGDIARLRGPVAVTGPSNDELFLTEYTGFRIRQLRYVGGNRSLATSWYVDTVAGTGVGGYVDGSNYMARFGNLVGAVYSPESSKLFICDRGNNRIRAMDLVTRAVTTVAGDGVIGSSDNADATLARFTYVNAITTDSTGALYIGDARKVRRLYDGALKTVAGGGDGSGTTGDKVLFLNVYGLGMNAQGDVLLNSDGRLVRLTRKLGR